MFRAPDCEIASERTWRETQPGQPTNKNQQGKCSCGVFVGERRVSSCDKRFLFYRMGDRYSAALAHLRSSSAATRVDLNGDKLGTGRVVLLARALAAAACPVAALDLTWNFMGDQGAAELAAALSSLTCTTVIKLPYNDIRADGIAAISLQLPLCSALTLLDLGRNAISGAGLIALAGALPRCSALSTLILASGGIGASDVRVLFEALPRCSSLHTLNLESR